MIISRQYCNYYRYEYDCSTYIHIWLNHLITIPDDDVDGDGDDALSKMGSNNNTNKFTFQAAFPPSAAPRHQTLAAFVEGVRLNWPMNQRDRTAISYRTREHDTVIVTEI